MSYLVFDIETVPDSNLWKPEPPKPRARKKDEFPPLYAHRPIVIGFALFDDDLKLQHLDAVASDDEAKLISDFTNWLAQMPATLVTFNGRGFDVPVLGLRAMRLGLSQLYNTAAHRKRYSEEHHLDLMEVLTEFGSLGRSGYSLDALTRVIGLGGKNGVDGSMVAGMYAQGQIEKIRGYCICDVGRQSFLMLRYLLLRGRITIEQYREAATALWQVCVDRQLGGITFAADTKTLLLTA